MDFRHLRHFESVARTGSLTRAADELGLTIPALSKSVQSLEKDLDTKLLERGPRGMRPTASGSALLDHARLAGNLLANARRAVAETRDPAAATVTVGAAPGAAPTLLPAAVAELRQRVPHVHVIVREGLVDLPRAVRVGDLDLALVAASAQVADSNLASVRVLSERIIVVGEPAEPGRQTLARLAQRDWVLPAPPNPLRVHLEERFAMKGHSAPRVAVESGSILFMVGLLERGAIVGYLPETLCREQLAARKLRVIDCQPLDWRRDLVAIWNRGLPLSAAAAMLLSMLQSQHRGSQR